MGDGSGEELLFSLCKGQHFLGEMNSAVSMVGDRRLKPLGAARKGRRCDCN
jgi:hypothetical protein